MLSRLPPVVRALLIANVAVFAAQFVASADVSRWGALWPVLPDVPSAGALPGFMPWQLLTYAFLHANFGHIFFNMLGLVMFGVRLERSLGWRRFALYYAVAAIGAGLCQLALASWSVRQDGVVYSTIGASGGVYGLLLAFGLSFPSDSVMPLPGLIVKARTAVIAFGVMELLVGVVGVDRGVAHFAHLGGMLFGAALLLVWRMQARRSGEPPTKKRPRHLRVVK